MASDPPRSGSVTRGWILVVVAIVGTTGSLLGAGAKVYADLRGQIEELKARGARVEERLDARVVVANETHAKQDAAIASCLARLSEHDRQIATCCAARK